MATVRLHAGTVADIGTTFGSGGSLAGSGAVWDDASDSTYLESKTSPSFQTGQAEAQLDTLTLPAGATVTGIRVNVRVQLLAASQTPAHLGIIIWPASRLSPQLGLSVPNTDLNGWLLDPADQGSIVDLSDDVDATQYSNSFTDLDSIVALLESGTAYITALARPIIFPSTNLVQIRVYELSVDVTYTAPIELPCDTWVDLDLSTAIFTGQGAPGGPFGQYGDGVIYTANFPGFPDFYFPGLDLDPTKRYRVEITYDPGSIHDSGGRLFSLSGVIPGQEDDPNLPPFFPVGDLYDGASNTDDVATATIGPGINGWDDPDFGVTAGYVRPWFETDRDGAVSAIRVRKLCTTAIPPLQLVNRRDAFSSAPSLVNAGFHRQGGNRLTGPI